MYISFSFVIHLTPHIMSQTPIIWGWVNAIFLPTHAHDCTNPCYCVGVDRCLRQLLNSFNDLSHDETNNSATSDVKLFCEAYKRKIIHLFSRLCMSIQHNFCVSTTSLSLLLEPLIGLSFLLLKKAPLRVWMCLSFLSDPPFLCWNVHLTNFF